MHLHRGLLRLFATLTIASLLLSSAPPLATPRALALAGPARPAAAEPAAPVAAPAPRVLSSVPVDSPAVPHPTPPPPSLPARAKIATTTATTATLLLLPNHVTGANDKIWRYRNGAWTGITPPQVGWVWNWIAADPFNSDRWLLLGNGSTGGNIYTVTSGSVTASDTTVSPLWLTLNAGVSWQPVTLTTPHRPYLHPGHLRSGRVRHHQRGSDRL
jgi:hypothetical protein